LPVARVIVTEHLDELAVARAAMICSHHTIARFRHGTGFAKSQTYSHGMEIL